MAPNEVAELIPEGAIYFTTRKGKDGWFAERIFNDNGYWKREIIDVPGGRMHAIEQMKIAIGRYWSSQKKLI